MKHRVRSTRNLYLIASSACAVALTLSGLGALPARVRAQDVAGGELPLGPFSIDDANPESSIPSAEQALEHPLEMGYLVMTLTERAEAAGKRGEHAKAAHYYLAIAKAGSDVAVGFSKACRAFAAAGDGTSALAACRDALARPGVKAEDAVRFVQLMLRKQGALTAQEIGEIDIALEQLNEKVSQSERGAHLVISLKCQLGVRLEDEARLASCVDAIRGWAPDDLEAFVFRSLFALKQERWDDAEQLLAGARRSGMPAEVIERTQESIAARKAWLDETRGTTAKVCWILAAAAVLSALFWLASRRGSLGSKAAI